MRSRRCALQFAVLFAGGALAVSSQAQVLAKADNRDGSPAHTDHSAADTSGGTRPAPQISQYTLGAADIVHVNVWKSAELSQTVTIGPDGFVSLPLLGDVQAAGLTTNQLAKDLGSRLSTYVVSAQVTVSVVEMRSRQVFVTGQVGRSGSYPLIAPLTVLQLIAQAGGLTTFADRKRIFILRETKGQTQRLTFNYSSATHGDRKQNIDLEPGDTVIVP